MPKERIDAQLAAQEEEEEATRGSPDGLVGDGEISAAADQLAAVALADNDDAGSGTSERSQRDSVDELHDPLSDPELWKPRPPNEDCPVCLVPLPLEIEKIAYNPCCGKEICTACNKENYRALEVMNEKRRKKDLPPLNKSCAFCRESIYKNDAEYAEQIKKRIDKGDDEAVVTMALWYLDGLKGLPKDEAKAMELAKRAAGMGYARAMHLLGLAYIKGAHGCPRDEKKGIGYLENAVKMGDVASRYSLGSISAIEGNFHLATKHYRLAAEAGYKPAMKNIWNLFSNEKLSKTDLEEILRAHQAACNEMDSEDRQRYDAWLEVMTF